MSSWMSVSIRIFKRLLKSLICNISLAIISENESSKLNTHPSTVLTQVERVMQNVARKSLFLENKLVSNLFFYFSVFCRLKLVRKNYLANIL